MKRRLFLAALAAAALAQGAHAQTAGWPAKTVRLVVPFTPGGTTDRMARLFGAHLSKELGQQFIVDNRPGASGTLGSEIVARAAPDGYTLAVVPSSFAINGALYKLPYHPVTGIEPIGMIVTGALIMTVHPSVPAKSLKEFVALARARPGEIRYGSTGAGTNLHLAGALFEQMTKTRMLHVPYKGQAPAIADLLSGEIQLMYSGASMLPHIKAGRLRGLAVTTEKRSPVLPDLPAIAEMLPGYQADFWTAMFAPKGTPKEIVMRINQEIGRFLDQPGMKEKLLAEGIQPAHTTPEGLAGIIARELATWAKVIKAANIKIGD
jgi:tripartite-type tricarboxylate transporter receptor subunit TctC